MVQSCSAIDSGSRLGGTARMAHSAGDTSSGSAPPRAAAWRARSTASAAPPSGMGRGAASPCTPSPPPPPSALPPILPLPAPSLRLQSSVAASWAVRRTWCACVVQMHGPCVMCVHGLCIVHVRTDDGAAGVWAPRSRMPTALTWLGVDARCRRMVRHVVCVHGGYAWCIRVWALGPTASASRAFAARRSVACLHTTHTRTYLLRLRRVAAEHHAPRLQPTPARWHGAGVHAWYAPQPTPAAHTRR